VLRREIAALLESDPAAELAEADSAAAALEAVVGAAPRVATPAYQDEAGVATLRLERALGDGGSPFANAMAAARAAVDALTDDVEERYKQELT
jgi:hypothetical protein